MGTLSLAIVSINISITIGDGTELGLQELIKVTVQYHFEDKRSLKFLVSDKLSKNQRIYKMHTASRLGTWHTLDTKRLFLIVLSVVSWISFY